MTLLNKLAAVAFCAVLAGVGGVAWHQSSAVAAEGMAGMQAPKDIIDTAVGPNMEEVTTLVAAVKAAGLVETLKGPGPFTVFAPTNAAFAKLPKGTVEDLLKPENKEKLVKILTYHVVPGSHDASEVMAMSSAKTVEGDELKIMTKDGKVMVGNEKGWATVIKPDIKCSNGVIHWIDTVVMPSN
ncbi:MAG: fasciclin domain-containing protein [Phycisphaerae bacterium]